MPHFHHRRAAENEPSIPASANPRLHTPPTTNEQKRAERSNVTSNLNPTNSTAALQGYLRGISFFNPAIPRLNIDGILGPQTQRAIRIFQEIYNIPQGQENTDYLTWITARDVWQRYQDSVTPGEVLVPLYDPRAVAQFPDDNFIALLQVMSNTIRIMYPELILLNVTGIPTPEFHENIRQIAALYGLDYKEKIDKPIWSALAKAYNQAISLQQSRQSRP